MKWHPLSEKPQTTEPAAALLATRDEDGEFFLMGLYLWREGKWVSEDGLAPLPAGEYWWCTEDDVLEDLRQAIA